MNKATILSVLSLLLGFIANAQYFTLDNSKFNVEDKLITYQIAFDYHSYDIKKESYEFLDSLSIFLSHHRNLTIEISCHTDEKSASYYYQDLTDRRAQSIAYYLHQKNILTERMIAVELRSKMPIVKNAKTELEHQKNRRVEIKILKVQ